eukprot:gene580-1240_t
MVLYNDTESNPQQQINNNSNRDNTEQWPIILKIIILILVMILTIVGNSLVCYTVYMKKELRTITGIFIVGLAISDLGVGIFCLPIAIASQLDVAVLDEQWLCNLNAFFLVLFFIASINTLGVTSIYKYTAVVFPWHKLVTKRRAIMIILCVWLVAFALAIGPTFGWSKYELIRGRYQCSTNTPHNATGYSHMVLLLLFGYILPVSTMVFCYSRVYYISMRHIRRMKSTTSSADKPFLVSETRLIKTLFIIVLVFGLCWLPFALYIFYAIFHVHIPVYLPAIAFYLGYSNSFLNPIVFASRLTSFRQGFKNGLGVLFFERRSKKGARKPVYYSCNRAANVFALTSKGPRESTSNKEAKTRDGQMKNSERHYSSRDQHRHQSGSDNKAFIVDGPNVPSKYRRISQYRMVQVPTNSTTTTTTRTVTAAKHDMKANDVFVIEILEEKVEKLNEPDSVDGGPQKKYSCRDNEAYQNEAGLSLNNANGNGDEEQERVISLTELKYEEFNKKLKFCGHNECKCHFGYCNVSRCISTKYDIHVIERLTSDDVRRCEDPCIHKVLMTVTWEDTTFDSVGCAVLKSRHAGVTNKVIDIDALPLFMKEHVRLEMLI